MWRSKNYLVHKYGQPFRLKFKIISKAEFSNILPQVPDIGESIFSFNYQFGPCYIAWYKAFVQLNLPPLEIDQNIWTMNERMLTIIPKCFLHACGKIYLNSFRKKALKHMSKKQRGLIHPYDWKIIYRAINSNSFEIDITECGLQKLAHTFNANGLLPGICRMDYLFSNLMGNGFTRTQTLGDGDPCCNCHYELVGKCDWSPEKGFIDRK